MHFSIEFAEQSLYDAVIDENKTPDSDGIIRESIVNDLYWAKTNATDPNDPWLVKQANMKGRNDIGESAIKKIKELEEAVKAATQCKAFILELQKEKERKEIRKVKRKKRYLQYLKY